MCGSSPHSHSWGSDIKTGVKDVQEVWKLPAWRNPAKRYTPISDHRAAFPTRIHATIWNIRVCFPSPDCSPWNEADRVPVCIHLLSLLREYKMFMRYARKTNRASVFEYRWAYELPTTESPFQSSGEWNIHRILLLPCSHSAGGLSESTTVNPFNSEMKMRMWNPTGSFCQFKYGLIEKSTFSAKTECAEAAGRDKWIDMQVAFSEKGEIVEKRMSITISPQIV